MDYGRSLGIGRTKSMNTLGRSQHALSIYSVVLPILSDSTVILWRDDLPVTGVFLLYLYHYYLYYLCFHLLLIFRLAALGVVRNRMKDGHWTQLLRRPINRL